MRDAQAVADHAGEAVEDVGDVAAGLLLHGRGHGEELQLEHVGAEGQLAVRVLRGQAEVLLLVAGGEFVGQGRSAVAGDGEHALGQGVAGAEDAGHLLQGVGELLAEPAEPAGAAGAGVEPRCRRPGECSRQNPAQAAQVPARPSQGQGQPAAPD